MKGRYLFVLVLGLCSVFWWLCLVGVGFFCSGCSFKIGMGILLVGISVFFRVRRWKFMDFMCFSHPFGAVAVQEMELPPTAPVPSVAQRKNDAAKRKNAETEEPGFEDSNWWVGTFLLLKTQILVEKGIGIAFQWIGAWSFEEWHRNDVDTFRTVSHWSLI